MKKSLFIITLVLTLLLSCSNAFAAESHNQIFPSSDSGEIEQIQTFVVEEGENTVAKLTGASFGPDVEEDYVISIEAIPEENIMKLYPYVRYCFTEADELIEEDFVKNIEDEECQYIVLTKMGENTYFETYQLQHELTAEDRDIYQESPAVISYLESHVGEYIPNYSYMLYGDVSFYRSLSNALDENNINNANIYLMNDFGPFGNRIIAVCFSQGEEPAIITLEEKTNGEKMETEVVATAYSLSDFQKAEAAIWSETEAYGGTVKKSDIYRVYAVYIGIGIAAIGLVTGLIVFIYRQKKSKKAWLN